MRSALSKDLTYKISGELPQGIKTTVEQDQNSIRHLFILKIPAEHWDEKSQTSLEGLLESFWQTILEILCNGFDD